MITIRANDDKRNYTWVDVRDINREDLSVLTEEYLISSDLLADIPDQDEQSRIEKEDDYTDLIVRIPLDDEDQDSPLIQNAIPLGIILYKDKVITICQGDSVVLEDFAKRRFRQYPVATKEGFVLSILGRSALVFIRMLKYINRQKDIVEERLHDVVSNDEIIRLLDIQKSLVYLTTSLTTNESLLEKLSKTPLFKLNSEDEIDFLNDVITDNKQAIAMANIYSSILTGTMEAFSSVLGNNMNIIMKRLTIISLALMFPTFITGFFGMNVRLPHQDKFYAWVFLLVICALVSIVGSFIINNWDKTTKVKKKKKKKKTNE